MLNKFSYKQKLKGIGIVSLLALVLCYRLSISRTIEEYQKYSRETSAIAGQAPDAASLADLQDREQRVRGIFTQYTLDTLQPEKNLLSVVSSYCKLHSLQLKEYKPYSSTRNDSIPVLTRTVTVGGPFVPCLRMLYDLERSGQVGRVSSADFKGYTDIQTKKTKMDCTLYIQNLIPINHEAH
jgi:hypothetical protein